MAGDGNKRKKTAIKEKERAELKEEMNEWSQRIREDETVGEMIHETEAGDSAKTKLKEIKKLLSEAKKQVEKAEHLLKEIICDRETENQKIEDAILLSDGILKVKEKESETED